MENIAASSSWNSFPEKWDITRIPGSFSYYHHSDKWESWRRERVVYLPEVDDATVPWVKWDLKPASSTLQPNVKPWLDPVSSLKSPFSEVHPSELSDNQQGIHWYSGHIQSPRSRRVTKVIQYSWCIARGYRKSRGSMLGFVLSAMRAVERAGLQCCPACVLMSDQQEQIVNNYQQGWFSSRVSLVGRESFCGCAHGYKKRHHPRRQYICLLCF